MPATPIQIKTQPVKPIKTIQRQRPIKAPMLESQVRVGGAVRLNSLQKSKKLIEPLQVFKLPISRLPKDRLNQARKQTQIQSPQFPKSITQAVQQELLQNQLTYPTIKNNLKKVNQLSDRMASQIYQEIGFQESEKIITETKRLPDQAYLIMQQIYND